MVLLIPIEEKMEPRFCGMTNRSGVKPGAVSILSGVGRYLLAAEFTLPSSLAAGVNPRKAPSILSSSKGWQD